MDGLTPRVGCNEFWLGCGESGRIASCCGQSRDEHIQHGDEIDGIESRAGDEVFPCGDAVEFPFFGFACDVGGPCGFFEDRKCLVNSCGTIPADLNRGSYSESLAAFVSDGIGLHRLAFLASDGNRSNASD